MKYYYFKFDSKPESLGILYDEYADEYNVRRAVFKNGQWQSASEAYRREYLADQPLSEDDPEVWKYEIAKEEFESAWNAAIEAKEKRRYFKMPLSGGRILCFEYEGEHAIRQVEIYNGQMKRSSEDLRRDSLTTRPLSESGSGLWNHEISGQEFEEIWQEAIRAEWRQVQEPRS